MVEKHHTPVPRSEGLGELAGAGPRSSSAGGGRPGNGGIMVDLLCIFSEHRQNRSKTAGEPTAGGASVLLLTGAELEGSELLTEVTRPVLRTARARRGIVRIASYMAETCTSPNYFRPTKSTSPLGGFPADPVSR